MDRCQGRGTAHLFSFGLGAASAFGGAGADKVAFHIGQAAGYRQHQAPGAGGADRIVAEVNNGADMVGATLRMVDPNVAFTAVHASRGKVVRAEPVAALYQQGRVRRRRSCRRE